MGSDIGTCPTCFQPEGQCYEICPRTCPWGGDHAVEDAQSQPDPVPPDMSDIDKGEVGP